MDALRDVEIAVAHSPVAAVTRRQEWLNGRRALHALLERMSSLDGLDPLRVRFPHPHLSLSHSGPTAVAAGCTRPGVVGVGVDVEERRWMRPATARFFLADAELSASVASDLPRLWTVKEALFKANVANEDTSLCDYVTDDPAAMSGHATGPKGCPELWYRTTPTARGYMTVAVATRRERSC